MQLLKIAFVLASLAPLIIAGNLFLSAFAQNKRPSVETWLDDRLGAFAVAGIAVWTVALVVGAIGWLS